MRLRSTPLRMGFTDPLLEPLALPTRYSNSTIICGLIHFTSLIRMPPCSIRRLASPLLFAKPAAIHISTKDIFRGTVITGNIIFPFNCIVTNPQTRLILVRGFVTVIEYEEEDM